MDKIIEVVKKGDQISLLEKLSFGADPNEVDDAGMSALCWSAKLGHAHCVMVLVLTPKIDITHCCDEGKSALDYATENNYQVCIDIIKEHLQFQRH